MNKFIEKIIFNKLLSILSKYIEQIINAMLTKQSARN